ncbi:hypothetical protein Moror_17896 [Moniliophthora roreri MCA 2997]|nr:hypothetical protein Moror_17896 [Moniliophthora roreri MCA 2997]
MMMDDQENQLSPVEAPAQPGAPKQKPKRHITNEGTTLLKETFFNKGIKLPTKEQKEDLLRRIRLLPGCEEYRMINLERWFATRRKAERPPKPRASMNSAYPSLKLDALENLAALFKETPSPSKTIIGVWASLLKATFGDVEAWVHEQQSKQDAAVPNAPETPLTPTSPITSNPYVSLLHSVPASHTMTPFATSPLNMVYYMPTHPVVKREASSPWADATSGPQMSLDTHHDSDQDEEDVEQELLATSPITEQSKDSARSHLLLAIHDDLESLEVPGQPSTSEEFQDKFSPYKKMMDRLMARVNDGSLKKWGIKLETGRKQ